MFIIFNKPSLVMLSKCHVGNSFNIWYLKKFYSFLFRKFGYSNVIRFAPNKFKCSVLKIEHLSDRRKNARILFVFDVLTSTIDSSKMLSILDINVPVRRLRLQTFIRIPNHRTNYASFEPVLTMSSLLTEVYYLFEFGQSSFTFENSIRSLQLMNEPVEWIHVSINFFLFW